MMAPGFAAVTAALIVLWGFDAVPLLTPANAPSTNTVQSGMVVVRATFTGRGTVAPTAAPSAAIAGDPAVTLAASATPRSARPAAPARFMIKPFPHRGS